MRGAATLEPSILQKKAEILLERDVYEADAEKTLLLVLFGVARTQKYITEKKVHELQTKLNELGRIIGGLQKHFINNR